MKTRHIDNPTDLLKAIQGRINRRIFAAVPFPPETMGGVSGRSIVDNARRHVRQPELAKLDIENFFASIRLDQVADVWRRHFKTGRDVTWLLTRLTTYHGHLPTGAPTSTALANLVFLPIAAELRVLCAARGLRFTVYVDDVTLSGPHARDTIEDAIRLLGRHGFSASRRKTEVMTRGFSQRVTGIVVNRKISNGGDRVSEIRRRILVGPSSTLREQPAPNRGRRCPCDRGVPITGLKTSNIAGKADRNWRVRKREPGLSKISRQVLLRQTLPKNWHVPLVLDTNIVRHLAEGEIPVDGLYALRNEGTSIHLAEGAAIELVAQLTEGRLAWNSWLKARRVLRKILCFHRPILLGREVRNRRSVYAFPHPPQYSADNPSYHHRVRYSWLSVVRAQRPQDLFQPFRVPPNREEAVLASPNVTATIEETRRSWTDAFERTKARHSDRNRQIVANLRQDEYLNNMAVRFAREIDADTPDCRPPESVRWDAVTRTMVLFIFRSLRRKHPYNVAKNLNDAFDLDLLRYLAVPAAICTRDRRLMTTLLDAGAWQARWVVTPESLLTRAGRQVLADLRWPDQD